MHSFRGMFISRWYLWCYITFKFVFIVRKSLLNLFCPSPKSRLWATGNKLKKKGVMRLFVVDLKRLISQTRLSLCHSERLAKNIRTIPFWLLLATRIGNSWGLGQNNPRHFVDVMANGSRTFRVIVTSMLTPILRLTWSSQPKYCSLWNLCNLLVWDFIYTRPQHIWSNFEFTIRIV